MFDGDTSAGPGTREAVLRGAGGVCAAVDAVCAVTGSNAGGAANAFCLVRPPGHHAETDKAMGFCFLNNVMIGAARAIDTHPSINRVAIFDFDVHHGNGTAAQAGARGRRNGGDHDVLYLSTHQHPFYPGTGYPTSYEPGGACGVVNVGLRQGDGGDANDWLATDGDCRVSATAVPMDLRDFCALATPVDFEDETLETAEA